MSGRMQAAAAARRPNHWLVLGIAGTIGLAVLAAASLVGLFDRGHPRREAVAAYIDQVNAVQRDLAIERQSVFTTYARVRNDPRTLSTSVPALKRAAASLRRFDARLRALRPPPDAARLHRRLIAMSAAEARFAGQIAYLGEYIPALIAERTKVAAAGRSLKLELTSSKDSAAQAATFDRFSQRLAAAMALLRAATPPQALVPERDHEQAQISSLGVTARRLAAAIRAHDVTNEQALLQHLGIIAAGQGNAVERRAIIAFDKEARVVNQLRLAVAQERRRLDSRLR